MMRPRRTCILVFPLTVTIIVWICWLVPFDSLSTTTAVKPTNRPTAGLFTDDGRIRECITGELLGTVRAPSGGPGRRPVDRPKASSLENEFARQRAFDVIFEQRVWGSNDENNSNSGIDASGYGSRLEWSQGTIAVLHTVVNALKSHLGLRRVRLLDLACGDMQWTSLFLDTRSDVDYTGYDIVQALIDSHRRTFADRPWRFERRDIVADDSIPFDQFDLILARRLFVCMTSADVVQLLSKLSRPDVDGDGGYFLATTSATKTQNVDLTPGDSWRFHFVNVQLPPMSLTPPLCMSPDGRLGAASAHYYGLWKLPLEAVDGCPAANQLNCSIGSLYSCAAVDSP